MRDRATQLLNGRQAIFSLSQGQECRFDREVFQRFVETAVGYGATHIQVGMMPFRYGSWVLPDNDDPYASWCNHAPAFFRVCPPKELQEWVSSEHAKEFQDLISSQLEIMGPFGLKGVCDSVEPMWLPEGVYRAHPRWRGPQCELGRIAKRPYFAPAIDEPEVLDLYRRSAHEFAERFPEIDQFSFLSNDSGAGLSWAPCLYPGMNGPPRHRTRDGGARIANWLKAIQDGAGEAGVELRLNVVSSGLPAEWVASSQQKLRPGLFVRWGNNEGESWGVGGASLGGGVWAMFYPALGLGDPASFVAGLQGAYSNPQGDAGRITVGISEAHLPLARILFDTFLDEPGTGLLNRTQTLLKAAERFCGTSELAENLVGVWNTVKTALHAIAQIRQKGFGLAIPFCGVSMRWLVRPLVPEPENLTPEETEHYRKFVFSAGTEEQNQNFGYVLGKAVFRGESVVWMSRWCLHEAIGSLKGAQASLNAVAQKIEDEEAAQRVSLFEARVGALACLAANIKNTIMYQYALDIKDQPQYGPNQMDYDDNIVYDQRALNLRKIAREELDNIAELIEILESHPDQEVVASAACAEEENVFRLGPGLVSDLRRKMEIMMDHWQDYERLYPSTKVWEFEPEPKGNICGTCT